MCSQLHNCLEGELSDLFRLVDPPTELLFNIIDLANGVTSSRQTYLGCRDLQQHFSFLPPIYMLGSARIRGFVKEIELLNFWLGRNIVMLPRRDSAATEFFNIMALIKEGDDDTQIGNGCRFGILAVGARIY